MRRIFFIFLLLLAATHLRAETSTIQAGSPEYNPTTQDTETTYCPSPESIMLDEKTGYWGIGDWISTEPSEEKKIVAFQGAQWVGTNIGIIICAYKSDNPTSFPVTIRNTTLAPYPEGSNWGKYENGRKNCPPYLSNTPTDIHDCPFKYPKKQKTPEDIYKTLDFFKDRKIQ